MKAIQLVFDENNTPCKICSKCGERKPLAEFHNSSIGAFGKRGDCKVCANKDNKQGYKNNRNNILEKNRERRLAEYGLNQEQYEQIYKKQEGKCLICKIEFSVLSVDHCHDTNKVRGLLCTHCNFGIGHFKNSIELLKSAIEFLEGSK